MGTMSPDAYARSLVYALTCHKRERAMPTVPYTIPYGSVLTGTEFREALAKKAQDLKTKRALKSTNKKLPTKVSEKNCIQAKMFQEANLEFSDVIFLISNRF